MVHAEALPACLSIHPSYLPICLSTSPPIHPLFLLAKHFSCSPFLLVKSLCCVFLTISFSWHCYLPVAKSYLIFLQLHELQHTRLPCLPLSPRVCTLTSIELMMPSIHLILCLFLLLLPSVFPSISVFSNESALHIRWPKYWSSMLPMNIQV